ncbi:hypothetical protein [Desulfosporosinus sp. OT]|uniref:dTMP kinase n=1 Tax=Desulfosporosinus sp. OT TaxID=913865 RepID=UPI000223A934|nr:hypothetical protein [Desulfosporosinus sp. OT]EGW38470.1 hypothetical protein DOT_3754 [Desulfosporosinus sp. OT]
MNPIICFIGLDGSGKSTSIGQVYKELKKQGIRVEVVRAAYVVKVMSFFIKTGKRLLLKKDNSPHSGDYKAYLTGMRNQARRKYIYTIFSFLTTCEFKLQIFFNICVKHWLGTTLLVDRYIYDNAVTYAANLGENEEYIERTISGKWKHAPKPDLIIYIKTPVEVCCSRKNDIPDPLYLEIREPLYDALASIYNVRTISGNQPVDSMISEVMATIQPLLMK